MKKISSLMTQEMKCIICFDNLKNIILVPCHHMAMCSFCYENLNRKMCPICRKNILNVVRIYIV